MEKQQTEMLLQLAIDLSFGDQEVIENLKKALEHPPKTTKEVGYYVSGEENDFENCFRHLISLLRPFTTGIEDKYSDEVFSNGLARTVC